MTSTRSGGEWLAADQIALSLPSVIGDTRDCPECGRPQHYTGTEYGWAHDAAVDTWHCADPRKDRSGLPQFPTQAIPNGGA